jgi:hypothetical protein
MQWGHTHLIPVKGARFGYIHNPYGKTKYAKRNLSMTPRVQALLSARHEAAGRPASGFVFPEEGKPKKPVPYTTIDSQHDRTLDKLPKIRRFRLYDLRHTMLTRLAQAGADEFVILKVAGHSSITVSQRNLHPTPDRLEDSFSKLDSYNAEMLEQAAALTAKEDQTVEPQGKRHPRSCSWWDDQASPANGSRYRIRHSRT